MMKMDVPTLTQMERHEIVKLILTRMCVTHNVLYS